MLQKTERFQSDVKKYTEIINNMSDEQARLESKKLLNDLIYEVKKMDKMYVDMVYARQLPTMGNDIRDKIVSIRKQLDQKINKNT